MQAKLLHVLQEREIERLGGIRPIPIDVRIVAATNQKVRALVDERRFRSDPYFRLNVVTVIVPALRERPEDLVPLADHLLRLHARRQGKTISGFDADALTAIRRLGWPGNATIRAELVSTETGLAGVRAELAAHQRSPSRPQHVVSSSVQARFERYEKLIRTEPVRARQEIAKHLDGDPIITPVEGSTEVQRGSNADKRAVISGRVKPNRLLGR